MAKIKEYKLRIVIDEDDEELIHISESYDCDEAPEIIKFEVGGDLIEAPKELKDYIIKFNCSDVLGLA